MSITDRPNLPNDADEPIVQAEFPYGQRIVSATLWFLGLTVFALVSGGLAVLSEPFGLLLIHLITIPAPSGNILMGIAGVVAGGAACFFLYRLSRRLLFNDRIAFTGEGIVLPNTWDGDETMIPFDAITSFEVYAGNPNKPQDLNVVRIYTEEGRRKVHRSLLREKPTEHFEEVLRRLRAGAPQRETSPT